ncbi:MAG: YegS/Rv2252/BmrU family lipid kinase [Saprospiraceae bacterium]|jgi:diacylglycerol kinase (ATP)|nr:YegS/Rv2252/BmrU family lipid kinase [Saprospiraceae bacterium]
MNQNIDSISCIINGIRPISKDIVSFFDALKTNFKGNISFFYTEFHGHATEIARNCSKIQEHLIIAVGGDGTFNEIVNGVLKSEMPDTAICLVPNGTGNDFCRAQSIRFDSDKILSAIKNAAFKYYDVGLICQSEQKRYFLNVMDAGFGGYATMLLDRQRQQGLRGGLSYSLAILRTFFCFEKPEVTIYIDNEIYYTGKLMMIAVSNSKSFGNGLIIYPDSKPDDGLLGVTTLGNVTIIDYLLNLSNLRKGNYIKHPAILYTTCSRLSVKIISGAAPIEADGEVFGTGDVHIEVVPYAIRIMQY